MARVIRASAETTKIIGWAALISAQMSAVICTAACPAAVPQTASLSHRTGMAADSGFGKVLGLLNGRHPFLDLTRKSALKSFHFTFGLSGAPAGGRTGRAAPRPSVEIRFVRDHRAYAAILFFAGGPCLYGTTDGTRSFLAMVDPATPSSVLAAHAGFVYFAAMLAGKSAVDMRTLAAGLTYQFGVTTRAHEPTVCLRAFGFIREKLRAADAVQFNLSPSPTLVLGWPNARQAAEESMRARFELRRTALFPLRSLVITLRRGGRILGTGWISHIGPGVGRSGPATHQIAGLESRAGLPWRACKSTTLYRRFERFLLRREKPPPLSRGFIALRRRFLKWAITPDAVRAHAAKPKR
jgi:hypothetical protein